ncbi:MAG: CRISPR-associated protein Cas5 [Psychrilyobacter sp.]|uniref:CRISPR-associated protein Cas5 n=1 Tax=Psychrilyobacter sp. TaxID=2586924 RepID=UPI003C7931C7
MRVLKIKIKQNQAHYRKEETQRNKMTYPLPPFSTVIGAIHLACGFTTYHPMNLSIQGSYQSLYKRPYTDYCFLNSIMDDRGILVKFPNGNLFSSGYTKVASTLKSQGNSFRKNITIDIHDQNLLDEYNSIKDLGEKLDNFNKVRLTKFKNMCKLRKKNVTAKKKKFDKKSDGFKKLGDREKEVKTLEKFVLDKFKEFKENKITNELNNYACLVTSLKYYEILTNVELVIHVQCEDESDLEVIRDNIYNLRAIGRSEDFVEVTDCEIVELVEVEERIISRYSAYLNVETLKERKIILGVEIKGTKYKLNKNYVLEGKKRIFERPKVLYTSNYSTKKKGGVLIDISEYNEEKYYKTGIETRYIVNLI